ncbi:MAG: cell wall-binding repeat-containing protein [Eubacteriales bacterium]|nr:cell wall-binding repeat-containing protein [Eubacteriales bacterium]MDD3074391.1 cell wall-binding repeat-containing protein [Eubacteriales bacterium]MDD4078800.1 cell wall-binding repeat-containing protein [Eubacteriales bacterium]MDD4769485.1 cell wall-binding repeat-containing protein [Eubacteriales bacterium]
MKLKIWSGLLLVAITLVLPFSPALSQEVVTETIRLSGDDRYETAAAISEYGWQKADTVVLARGDDYADALSGVPLAHALGAPMLLTNKTNLSNAAKTEINRLQAKDVYLLGGAGALSQNIEKELTELGLNVLRVYGSNRYETAAEVARELAKISTPAKAVLAYAFNFPDALAAASYAAIEGFPILLVSKDTLPGPTQTVIEELSLSDFIVVGGTGVISDTLANSLPSRRVSGSDRFETAVELAKYFNPGTERLYLATGLGFADAITGGVLAAKTGNGMLLVQQKRIPSSVKDYIDAQTYGEIIAFGGTGVVSESVLNIAAGKESEDPPSSEEPPAVISPGTWLVGKDIEPGIYRSDGTIYYWARLSGLSGELDDILANDAFPSSPVYVEIKASDHAFETKGTGSWYKINLDTYTGKRITSFSQGSYLVGKDIEPGLYRSANGFNYWARLNDFSGDLFSIIANDAFCSGPALVEIKESDFGFEVSGKTTWYRIDLATYSGERLTSFGDGCYIVGKDIEPGLYRSTDGCDYWGRLRDFSGELNSIIANDAFVQGPVIVEIRETDVGFETRGANWEKIE